MAQIEVMSETEDTGGWAFEVQILTDDGDLRRHTVRLAWPDYNHWSGTGADAPADVAAAVVRFLLARDGPDALRPRFDASLVRRLHPDADAEIPGLIHP